jgi:hypothetical protein
VFTLGEGDCGSAFDSSGDLWEGSDGKNTLKEWTKPQLARERGRWHGPGAAVSMPKMVITSSGGPCEPVFDRAGDLWGTTLKNGGPAGGVVEYTKAQLAHSGSTAPKVVISSSSFSYPSDPAFDGSGDLWVPNQGRRQPSGAWVYAVVEFTKAQLTKSGSRAPASTISGPATKLNFPFAVAIEP